jgi:hypothetical protein
MASRRSVGRPWIRRRCTTTKICILAGHWSWLMVRFRAQIRESRAAEGAVNCLSVSRGEQLRSYVHLEQYLMAHSQEM